MHGKKDTENVSKFLEENWSFGPSGKYFIIKILNYTAYF